MSYNNPRIRMVLALSIAAVVASCGGDGGGGDNNNGGGGGGGSASNTPPDSASASVQGFIDYLKTVVPTMPNTIEPLSVEAFVAPTSDTTEPDASI